MVAGDELAPLAAVAEGADMVLVQADTMSLGGIYGDGSTSRWWVTWIWLTALLITLVVGPVLVVYAIKSAIA